MQNTPGWIRSSLSGQVSLSGHLPLKCERLSFKNVVLLSLSGQIASKTRIRSVPVGWIRSLWKAWAVSAGILFRLGKAFRSESGAAPRRFCQPQGGLRPTIRFLPQSIVFFARSVLGLCLFFTRRQLSRPPSELKNMPASSPQLMPLFCPHAPCVFLIFVFSAFVPQPLITSRPQLGNLYLLRDCHQQTDQI